MLWWMHALTTYGNMPANLRKYTRCLLSSLQSGVSLVLTGGVVFLTIPSHCLKVRPVSKPGPQTFWHVHIYTTQTTNVSCYAFYADLVLFCKQV